MAGPTGNPVSGLPAEPAVLVNPDGRATAHFKQWLRSVKRVLQPGISTNVALAKLTAGGANGSIQVVNGIIVGYTAPT